jgi:uncharacterized protein (AIM24 family)
VIGTTMPVLEIDLKPGQTVISKGGELSWMTANVQMTTSTAGAGQSEVMGVFKRAIAGGSIFMTQYQAAGTEGTVAFATKIPGHIKPVTIDASHEYMVSQHGFLAATPNVTSQHRFPAAPRRRHLRWGWFHPPAPERRRCRPGSNCPGSWWSTSLGAGEQLLVHPGHVGLFEAQMAFEVTTVKGIKNMLFGAESIFLARLRRSGQGLVADSRVAQLRPRPDPICPGRSRWRWRRVRHRDWWLAR